MVQLAPSEKSSLVRTLIYHPRFATNLSDILGPPTPLHERELRSRVAGTLDSRLVLS